MAKMVTCRNCKHNTLHEEDGEQYNWCEIDNDNYDVSEMRECAAYMAAKNSDVLRAMSDEELADKLWSIAHYEQKKRCISDWLDWLRSPVEVEG